LFWTVARSGQGEAIVVVFRKFPACQENHTNPKNLPERIF
jgi:hypothetical protein